MSEKLAIFIGSSVCVGSGATNDRGWSALLAEKLEKEGWTTSNCAIGGQTTSDILLRLNKDVIEHKPDVCFVGLGLANEGLERTQNETEAAVIRGIFESNLKKIVSTLQKADISVILGGVYPNNGYNTLQYRALLDTNEAMLKWNVPVLNWLSALDDGCGRFKDALFHDAGHPNDAGYKVMFEQIPDNIV